MNCLNRNCTLQTFLKRRGRMLLLILSVVGMGLLAPRSVDASRKQVGEIPTPTIAAQQAQRTATATTTPMPLIVHIVKAGETLAQIADLYGVTIDQIVKTNRLRNPNYLFIGQRLTIFTAAAMTAITPTPAHAGSIAIMNSIVQDEMICPDDALVIPLTLPADPIRMSLVGDQLFLLANGDLYQIAQNAMVGGQALTPTNLMPPARMIGPYLIRELVYMTVDESNGDLLLLDKTNDIYRYSMTNQWAMAFPATPVPDQFPDPQYLAIQGNDTGVYALDADLSRIWLLQAGVAIPQVQLRDAQLLAGVDMVLVSNDGQNPAFAVLARDGSISHFSQEQPHSVANLAVNDNQPPWPAQLFIADGTLYAVDGEARRLIGIDPQTQQVVRKLTFRLPNVQRLRSAIIQNKRLYALAGPNLYLAEHQNTQVCPAVPYDNNYYFAGSNVLTLLADFQLPFPNTLLPDRPRSYPGARRLYRYGLHEGLDIYHLDAAGLHVGSPVLSVADGVVLRADWAYVEMSPDAYEAAITQSAVEHRTPPTLIDRFLGRQVYLSHGPGVESRYGHLDSIAPGIAVGQPVVQGTSLGTVGVSGTSAGAYGTTDGAHLHFELWINGRYLGQGLSLYETMRLWQAVFAQP